MLGNALARILAISSICLLAIPSASLAKEGFNSSRDSLPEPIKPAWEATFWAVALPGHKGGTGSAVLVSSSNIGSGRLALYVLTADHVVTSKCGPQLGLCQNIVLSSSRSLDSAGNNVIEESPVRTVTGAEVVARLEPEDIALLKIEVDAGPDWALRPVSAAKHCDLRLGQPVFLIGFPNTPARAAADTRAIDDQNVVRRRWSEGIVLDPVSSQGDWIGITADALQGSSGGPAFNLDGELVGIVHRVSGNRYVGDESEDQARRKWQSLLVLCDSVRNFLEDTLR